MLKITEEVIRCLNLKDKNALPQSRRLFTQSIESKGSVGQHRHFLCDVLENHNRKTENAKLSRNESSAN